MTGETLLYAMEYIGADLVDEAEKRQFREPTRRHWASLAACFVLLAGLILGAFYLLETGTPPSEIPLHEADPVETGIDPEKDKSVIPEKSEYSPKEPENRFMILVYRRYIYYLTLPLEAEDVGLEDMCVLCGVVDAGQPLAGAVCYYDAEYVTWLKTGVPLEMFLEYNEKYYYAFTYGEQADRTMAYTYEEAKAMTGEELKTTFVEPIECRALDETLTYQVEKKPTSLEQLALFGGIVWMEDHAGFTSRYSRADRWMPQNLTRSQEESNWELHVPAADIQALLDTYFDGCIFDPRELHCYDSEQDTVRINWQYMPYGYERSDYSTSLVDFCWDDDAQTVRIQIALIRTALEKLPEQNEMGDIPYQEVPASLGQKCYIIQFTDQGPKSLRIDWEAE